MEEGWLNADYLILFSEAEVDAVSSKYSVSELLPHHVIVGLRGWDDFIIRDNSNGALFTIPAVPMDTKYLKPFNLAKDVLLNPDERFRGKIKWYLKPIVFGGDPMVGENVTWVTHDQHPALVTWWNKQYRALKGPS